MSKMTGTEKQAVTSLSLIMALRMIGLFMVVPIFALYAKQLTGATPFLIGMALGVYGITQALLQIPFGLLSDHLGRRPILAIGLLLFALGSGIAALSSSIYGVIFGRALQGGGAIGSTLLALLADLTREDQRTKAMAISGMSIGLSFALAIIIGPLLAEWLPIQNLFWLALLFSFIALGILYLWTPQPSGLHSQPETESEVKLFFALMKNPNLFRLNSGIFFLHAIFTASFVVLPISLYHHLGLPSQEQWKLYLPILLLSFLFSLSLIVVAERQHRVKPYFIASIIMLALAELFLRCFPESLLWSAFGLSLFFAAFSLLEAFLPSLVSRTAPPARKGTAMGLYSCSQFLGIFAGGAGGGWFYQHQGLLSVYLFCFTLSLLWLALAYRMSSPPYLTTRSLSLAALLDTQEASLYSWSELAKQLQLIPGVVEINFLPEEKMAYLKVETQALQDPDFLRIEQLLQHPPH